MQLVDQKLSLILPAHNEEANLEAVVRDSLRVLPAVFTACEVIVVDDGSQDATSAIADRLVAEDDRVRAIHHPRNRGYGAALTTGFAAATGDLWMFMDSDRQFDIADVERLAPYVEQYDIVAGYRIKRQDPFYRFLIGSTFNLIVTVLFGLHLRDIDCGFKIFRAEVLRDMQLQSPGALINTEIHAKAKRQGRSMVEVGVNHFPRTVGEQSGASLKVVLRAGKEMVVLWWRMLSYVPPNQPERRSALPRAALAAGAAALVGVAALILRRGGRRPPPD